MLYSNAAGCLIDRWILRQPFPRPLQSRTRPSPDKKDERKEEIVKEHYEIDLSAGNYTAGKDIRSEPIILQQLPEPEMYLLPTCSPAGLNEVMSPDDDGISQQSFNGLKMKKDVVLTVGGDVVIHLIAEDAQTGTVAASEASEVR